MPDYTLESLKLHGATLVPDFSPETTTYTVSVGTYLTRIAVEATLSDPTMVLNINGTVVQNGQPFYIPLNTKETTLTIVVSDPGGG